MLQEPQVNAVKESYRKKREIFNSAKSKHSSKNEPANDDHEPLKVEENGKHGLLTFWISENGLSLRLKYKSFLSPSSVSLALGLTYYESEKSFSELCSLLRPSHIDVKQGQETCKGGYKKFGWCLEVDEGRTFIAYRKGGAVKCRKLVS